MHSLSKASIRPYKTRSGVRQGVGSHQPIQSLLAPPMGFVRMPWEPLGFEQTEVSWRVPQAGGGAACPPGARPSSICGGVRSGDTARDDGRVKGTLSPSPLPIAVRGFPAIFPPFFVTIPIGRND